MSERMMKAVVCRKYGEPEVMGVRELPVPAVKKGEVLVRIRAALVTATDCTFRLGKPLISRFFSGLRKPKYTPGDLLAGTVESVGEGVTRFKPGDRVFGFTDTTFGAQAEYRALPEGNLCLMDEGMEFGQAAAVCDGGLTALPFLRDTGKIQAGQKVLVIGASGSVGSAAVELAVHFGADVTGVCGPDNLEMVRTLGAGKVIDYRSEDFRKNGTKYDIIFDAVGKSSFGACKGSLTYRGSYMTTVPTFGTMMSMLWTKLFCRKRAKTAATGLRKPALKTADLEMLKGLIREGKYRPVMDRSFSMAEIVEAHRYVAVGHKKGNVVLRIAD